MNAQHHFRTVVAELARLHAARETAMHEAFAVLEIQESELAALVLQNLGDRTRAARWMCMHQRAFGGRSAYEALADGEVDRVWDRLLDHQTLAPGEARMAY
jgi:hypothetical protein